MNINAKRQLNYVRCDPNHACMDIHTKTLRHIDTYSENM